MSTLGQVRSSSLALVASLWLSSVVAGCSTEIQHDLEEVEANEILVLLESNGIAASRERAGRSDEWIVSVPTSDASRSWQLLMAHGLPRREVGGFDETFGEPSLIPSPTEERVRLQRATAGQLERSLMAMDHVVDARVHLVLPVREPLLGRQHEPAPPQAAVLIVFRPNVDGGMPVDIEAARQLVTAAVAGLAADDVTVVTTPREVEMLGDNPELSQIGPLVVTSSTRRSLQLLLGSLGGLILVLSAVIVMLVAKRRRPAPT
jgi:type III secretion protein J